MQYVYLKKSYTLIRFVHKHEQLTFYIIIPEILWPGDVLEGALHQLEAVRAERPN